MRRRRLRRVRFITLRRHRSGLWFIRDHSCSGSDSITGIIRIEFSSVVIFSAQGAEMTRGGANARVRESHLGKRGAAVETARPALFRPDHVDGTSDE